MHRFLTRVVLAIAFILTVGGSVLAQASLSTGAVRGVVVDQRGESVSGALVSLTNEGLNIRKDAKTAPDGVFIFPLLQPASAYRVSIESTGFERATIVDIVVRVSEITNVNVSLRIGAIQQETPIIASQPTVQTTRPTLGGTLPTRVVTSLPLNTRNPLQLLATDAGVVSAPGSVLLFVAGSRATSNNYSLNGADANNFQFNSMTAVPTPNPDAVQEFRTETSLYDASTGRGGGGNISLIIRSGSQDIHGNAYWFHRSSALSANEFFLNRGRRPKPFLLRNHFGGSLGGPLPGKKTFWFANYEGSRQITPFVQTASLPVLPQTRDAATLAAAFGLPVSSIDPVAVKLLNLPGSYDGQLVPSGTGAAAGKLGNFAYAASAPLVEDQGAAKIDHDLSLRGQQNHIAFSVFFARSDAITKIGDRPSPNGLGSGTTNKQFNRFLSLNDVHTFSPRFINELTLGVNIIRNDGDNFSTAPKLSEIGMSRFNSSLIDYVPMFGFSDQLGFGTNSNSGALQHTSSGTIRDIVHYNQGKHSFRFGFENRLYQFTYDQPFNQAGTLNFSNQFANATYGTPATVDNLSIRDFLIGAPSSYSIRSGVSRSHFRAYDLVGFVQDEFRLNRRLTLNLGLRYDFYSHVAETNHHLGNFDASLVPVESRLIGGPGLLKGLVFPEALPKFGTPGVPDSGMNSEDKNNIAPRVGFALDVLGNGRLALRGGYGLYYVRVSALPALQLAGQPPFSITNSKTGSLGSKILANPFPTLPLSTEFPVLPAAPTLTGYTSAGAPIFDNALLSFIVFDRNLITPYTQQWNLTAQYEFLPRWVAEVGYLGTHGVKLLANSAPNDALLRNANNPAAFGLITNSSTNRDARVSTVGIGPTGINLINNGGGSTYNAAVVTVSRQFSDGLFFKGAYTFSKTIDNGFVQGGFDFGNLTGNQFFTGLDKGPANFDAPHRLVVTYVYDIPGPRQSVLKHILGGWSMSGLVTYMSGFPILYTQSVGNTSLASTGGRPNFVPGCNLTNPGSITQKLDNYLNASCLSLTPLLAGGTTVSGLSPYDTPGNQTYTITANGSGRLQGSMGRNIGHGPLQSRWDFGLAKRVGLRFLGEAGNLEFRAEFFNLFNHPSFNRPSGTVGTSGFGRITSTSTIPRQIQFALRINF